ncbi:MAG: DUF5615 family PIN-like protein [Actinomycetota bacterium]|nr:DUF5615 family PIN-like protein [Actinomycetota bacterium]
MRVKLDENLPVSAVELLRAAGYEVDTAPAEGLQGRGDADFLEALGAMTGSW